MGKLYNKFLNGSLYSFLLLCQHYIQVLKSLIYQVYNCIIIQGHDGEINSIILTDSNYEKIKYHKKDSHKKRAKWLFSCGKDGDIRKYDIRNCQCVKVIKGKSEINSV